MNINDLPQHLQDRISSMLDLAFEVGLGVGFFVGVAVAFVYNLIF